jgi:predicted HicB family RNase H-like nuclease
MHSIEGVVVDERVQAIQEKAHELFQAQKNWAIFFREILGTSGIVHKLYTDGQSLAAFEKTRDYMRLQEMLCQLRDVNGQPPKPEEEGTRVITVRLPSCVHQALKDEAHARDTSMNQLCISKLLQRIDAEARPTNGKLEQPKQPEISPL